MRFANKIFKDNLDIIVNKVKHATVNIIHLSTQDAHILPSFVDKIGGIIIFNISIVAFFWKKFLCYQHFFYFCNREIKNIATIINHNNKSNYFAYE